MQLTPDDIQNQQFHIRFRGFDVEEVDSFLERVGENYLLLSKEKQELEEKVAELEYQLSDFREREKTFQNAILSTQKVADEIEANSRREAEKRLQDTRHEIERIREEAQTEVTSLRKRTEELKETKARIKKELKEFLQSYLDLVNEEKDEYQQEWKEAAPGLTSGEYSPESKKEETAEEEETNLYEKIDLPEDIELPGMSDLDEDDTSSPASEEDLFNESSSDNSDKDSHPALNGKMLFNLEDPIDYEPEPAVIIEDPASEDREEREK